MNLARTEKKGPWQKERDGKIETPSKRDKKTGHANNYKIVRFLGRILLRGFLKGCSYYGADATAASSNI